MSSALPTFERLNDASLASARETGLARFRALPWEEQLRIRRNGRRLRAFPKKKDLSAPNLNAKALVPLFVEGELTGEFYDTGKYEWRKTSEFRAVSSWLVSYGLRVLNEKQLLGPQPLPLEALEDFDRWRIKELAVELYEYGCSRLPPHYEDKPWIDFEEQCLYLAEATINIHRPDFVDRLAKLPEWGRKGGTAPRRKKVTFDELLEVNGMSDSLAAKKFNVSRATIIRRRQEGRAAGLNLHGVTS